MCRYPETTFTHSLICRQFHERYSGFKVPLAQLKTGHIMKHLQKAGSTFSIISPQLLVDKALGEVDESTNTTVISETEEMIDFSERSEEVDGGGEDADKTTRKRSRKRKEDVVVDVDVEASLQNKFVDLTDLFPPLPKKGDFKVETIKKSQYFFS
jgi:DNA-directed RNA polymerase